ARALKAGYFPLWSTGSYGGFPFAGDIQSAVFYPPRLLAILLTYPLDSFPQYALMLEGLAHIWLAGVGAYALAYHITRQQTAALLAAVSFGLGGYLTSYPLLQLAVLETIAWLPLVLLCIRVAASRTQPLRWIVGAGLMLGLSSLAGHPQTFLQAAYLTGVYYLFCAIRAQWHWQSIISLGLVWSVTALGLFSMAAAPTLRYAQATSRAEVSYDFVSSGQPLNDLIQILVPGDFSTWQVNYYGLATLVFVLIAWRFRRQSSQRSEILFWVWVAIICSWLALGDAGILFAIAHRFAPGLSLFRQQERWMNLVSLAVPMLSAIGWASFSSLTRIQKRPLLKQIATWLAIAFGAVLLLLIAIRPALDISIIQPVTQQIVILLVVFFCLGWRSIPSRVLPILLLCLLTGDLYANTIVSVGRVLTSGEATWPRYEWMSAIEQDDAGRLESRMQFWSNAGEIHGWEDLSGISPLKFKALNEFERLPEERRWQLLDVTHIVAAGASNERMTPVAPIQNSVRPNFDLDLTLFHYTASLGRAHLVYDTHIVENETAAFDLMRDSAEFNPATTALLHDTIPDLSSIQPPDVAPLVTSKQAFNQIDIETDSATAGVLVVSNWFYPGWQATIDGAATDLFPVNAAQIGLLVPAGTHEVALRFRPNDVLIGIAIATATLLLALVLPRLWQPEIKRQHWHGQFPTRTASLTANISEHLSTRLSGAVAAMSLILCGVWLRAMRLSSAEFDPIEAAVLLGEQPLGTLWDAILRLWVGMLGSAEFSQRTLSTLLSAILLALIYRLARQISGARVAVLALLFAAISQPMLLLGSRVDNGTLLATILLLCITILSGRLIQQTAISTPLRISILYVTTAVTLIFSHPNEGLLIISLLTLAWWLRHKLGKLVWLVVFGASVLFYIMTIPTDSSDYANFAVLFNKLGFALGSGWFDGPRAWRWLWVLSLLPIGIGIKQIQQQQRVWADLLTGWLLGGMLLLSLAQFSDATLDPLDALLLAPPWWILYSSGVGYLWKNRQLAAQLVALVALLMPIAAFVALPQLVQPALPSQNWRRVAEIITNQAAPNELIVSDFTDSAQRYYFQDSNLPFTLLHHDHPTAEAQVRDLAPTVDRVWYLTTEKPDWDLAGLPFRWLEGNSLREQALMHSAPSLYAYRAAHALEPAILHVASPATDNSLQLDGIHIAQNGRWLNPSDQIRLDRNGELNVTLVWSALRDISADYTAFVHLLDANGALVAQHDGIPTFGNRRTQNWPLGTPIIDPHLLTLNELSAGTYDLLIGMYDSTSIEKLPFENGFADYAWRIFVVVEEEKK
ncbi:MAG: hypothetical protein ACPG8W_22835, partial [Candidatus Promineifilaceae bacterium]